MHYVGLDVHQRLSAVCILDENGKREKQFIVRGPWAKLFEALGEIPGPLAMCYEASNGYGFLYDLLSEIGDRVVVAHPGQLRLILRSKRKHDRVDAEKLANASPRGKYTRSTTSAARWGWSAVERWWLPSLPFAYINWCHYEHG